MFKQLARSVRMGWSQLSALRGSAGGHGRDSGSSMLRNWLWVGGVLLISMVQITGFDSKLPMVEQLAGKILNV